MAVRSLTVALAVALTAGIAVAVLAPAGMRSTRYGDYAPQVENLKAGRGFVDGEGRVMHRYPPLYPLMLWGLERLAAGTGLPLFGVLAGFAILCNTATAAAICGTWVGTHICTPSDETWAVQFMGSRVAWAR